MFFISFETIIQNDMNIRILITTIAFSLTMGLVSAQTTSLVVREKAGTENAYSTANVRKLTFSAGNLVVTPKIGTDDAYALATLNKLYFKQTLTALSTEEVEVGSMGIFPNPVTDLLHLRLQGATTQVQIVDMQGKVWHNKTAEGKEAVLNVAELPAGLYACTLKSEKATKTIKFIKQ